MRRLRLGLGLANSGYKGVYYPSVISISRTLGDISGGQSQVITGTGFKTGAVVTFRQSGVIKGTATGVAIDSPTQITCITPALAAGLYDIVVTNPDGGTAIGLGIFEAWHPNVENLGLLLLPGTYAVASGTWASASSAGNSGLSTHSTFFQTGLGVPQPEDDGTGCPHWNLTTGNAGLQCDAAVALPNVTSYTNGTWLAIHKNVDPRTTPAGTSAPIIRTSQASLNSIVVGGGPFLIPNSCPEYSKGNGVGWVPGVSISAWNLTIWRYNSTTDLLWNNDGSNASVIAGVQGSITSPDTGIVRVGGTAARGLTLRLVAMSPLTLSDAVCMKFYVWASGKGYLI